MYSHVVKSLKFGTQFPPRGRNKVVNPGMELEGLSALEDRVYTTDALHTAPHHYVKVGFGGSAPQQQTVSAVGHVRCGWQDRCTK